jgi:hypothetical protein
VRGLLIGHASGGGYCVSDFAQPIKEVVVPGESVAEVLEAYRKTVLDLTEEE